MHIPGKFSNNFHRTHQIFIKKTHFYFQITTSLIDGGLPSHTLMLADTESEKAKWVVALSELHRILKRNNLPNTAIFRVREVLDSSLSVLRNAQSALIIDPDRMLLGTEDGLFCLDLDRSGNYS